MVIVGTDIIGRKLVPALSGMACDRLFVLCDEAVATLHAERIAAIRALTAADDWYLLSGGETIKQWENCLHLWRWLSERGASRHSLLLNIGGGTITDLGGFVASVYKRGIRTVNLSTTLMGMVDASVGGKTGIDFEGVKNEIGTFHLPKAVFCDCAFLSTLPDRELLSGHAELVKHALLMGADEWKEVIFFDPFGNNMEAWEEIVRHSVTFKESIVNRDLHESGLRSMLNLGHTVGHAMESFSYTLPGNVGLSHGHAVIIGLICELYYSVVAHGFPREILYSLVAWSKEYYSPFFFTCKQYPSLTAFCMKDKKNLGSKIRLIPLKGIGLPAEPCEITEKMLHECFDFYRETLGG